MWATHCTLSFLVAVMLHIPIARYGREWNRVMTFWVAGGVVGLALLILQARVGSTVELLAACLTYALVCELYIFLFTLVGSSLLASLLLVVRAGGSVDHLRALSDPRLMVSQRLNALCGTGFLARTPDGYVTTAKGRLLVLAFHWGRRFFRHECL